MQICGQILLVVSSSLTLALVALGMSLVGRCIGVVLLETLPLGIGLSLVLLSFGSTSDAAVLSGVDVVPLILSGSVTLFLFHPFYVAGRRRLGGESLTLMFSFAVMTCWIQAMSIFTESKSVKPDIPLLLEADQALGLKIIVILSCVAALVVTSWLLNIRGSLAAIQLSMGDSRLLTTFGVTSLQCQRVVIVASILLISVGSLLYISLQQNFSFQNSYDIIIPAFAISLSQPRIRMGFTVLASLILLTGIECLTRISSQPTIREGHQAVLFGGMVLAAVTWRIARNSGRLEYLRRKCGVAFRRPSVSGVGNG